MFIPPGWRSKIINAAEDTDGMSPAEVVKGQSDNRTVYIKSIDIRFADTTYSVKREAEMMKWLHGKLRVPEVMDYGQAEDKEYLVMSGLAGRHIDDFAGEPEAYIRHLANSITCLQSIGIADCPFLSDISLRLRELRFLLDNNLADTNAANWELSTQFTSPEALYDWLRQNKPAEELTFSHGDISANIIIHQSHGSFIDLARAGIADKWLDIAFCVRDIREMDPSGKYEKLFFQLLGVEPDEQKINYFILLDELF